jgi:two-component system, chemotaxis family, protein-glutamate methylesterase/glutaminase
MVPTHVTTGSTVASDLPSDVEAIVVGASAGALEALQRVLPALPAEFPCPVIVVVHVSNERPSLIVPILAQTCVLPVRAPDDKEPVTSGIWIAPPGYHLLIERDRTFALSVDEPLNYSRPSIDVLFESAAEVYGERLVCVVLTGANDDGASGACAIHDGGGYVLVQDPEQALWPTMPRAAIALAGPQCVAPLETIALLLCEVGKARRA